MSKAKILYVIHNHPVIRPGGSEAYAFELYQAMRGSDEFEPVLLARTGPPVSRRPRSHEGTLLASVNEDRHQHFMYTDAADFDWFYGTTRSKDVLTNHYHRFLQAYRPAIVHFQHTLFLGYDMILQTRRTLPDARIVYTLHEYLPICHRNGQMVRTITEEPCRESSPRRCNECFPEITPQSFFMRKRFVLSHLSLVDVFIAPSRFLVERYVDWGIPREKIQYEEYGRQPVCVPPNHDSRRLRNRIGFFGQLNFFKGVNVLLEAVKILADENRRRGSLASERVSRRIENPGVETGAREGTPETYVYGANLDLQEQSFQDRFRALLKAGGSAVTFGGAYDHTSLAKLISGIDWVVVPSIWWENSPLVIQEAFQYRRPVICSDIGGMAEKVVHGVNGLHFRAGDPDDLARTIRHAVETPGLWERLSAGIPKVYDMRDHTAKLAGIYRKLLQISSPEVSHA